MLEHKAQGKWFLLRRFWGWHWLFPRQEKIYKRFAAESQSNRRYRAFARKAEDEGFKKVAILFRAAAEAETVHAHSHLRALGRLSPPQKHPRGHRRGDPRIQENVPRDAGQSQVGRDQAS